VAESGADCTEREASDMDGDEIGVVLLVILGLVILIMPIVWMTVGHGGW